MQLLHRLRDWTAISIRFIRGREPIVLVGLLMVAVGTLVFIALADAVVDGITGDFDAWAVAALRDADDPHQPIGPPWMSSVGRDLTALGGVSVLTLLIVAATGFLAVQRAYRTMIVLVASTLTGIFASMMLKQFFARPRPDLVPHLDQVYTSSFPSGHSMMSALVYLTLGALIAPILTRFWLRFYVLMLAMLLTGLVGISRVYMGVHYPTDVLAGWAAGTVWALACWLIARSVVQTGGERHPVGTLESQTRHDS